MDKAKVGDFIQLKNQRVEVVECKDCEHLMVNIDANQLAIGDLVILKKAGVRISNPETEKEFCVDCEDNTVRRRLTSWWDNDDDDDTPFFSGGIFRGGSSGGGFGGFGGFGGGSFGGGGASRGF